MDRRLFLELCGLTVASGFYSGLAPAARAAGAPRWLGNEIEVDVVIAGGGLGGCAAAMAALRAGAPRVLMTEPTDWIGGQLTQQAVPPDENRYIETHGATRSYRQFREHVRDYYRRYYPLTDAVRDKPNLNPGNGRVSRLCHEPRVALAVLEAMLAPAITAGRLVVLLNTHPIGAEVDGDQVRALRLACPDGSQRIARAPFFIDATEEGDLLPLTGAEFVTGFESRAETGEDHAPDHAQPDNIQSLTWVLAAGYREGEDHTIERPATYDFWRDYVPQLEPKPWPGKLLALHYSRPRTLEPLVLSFIPSVPTRPLPATPTLNLWLYRRIVDGSQHEPGAMPTDATIVNWPQNDYWLGNVYNVSPEERARNLEQSRQLSLSLLYWLQTEAPRPDGGQGWPGLCPRGDLTGTPDGLAKYPYIRESRRMRAEFTILEGHVGRDMRLRLTGAPPDEVTAEPFPDSVGVGLYNIDLHPSTGGDNYIDFAALPFRIPLGALIHRRVENLLAANKNIGSTHLTNGCYRLHPVEWNIGEAAGALAAFCLARGEAPRRVRNDEATLADFQRSLTEQGFELAWRHLPAQPPVLAPA